MRDHGGNLDEAIRLYGGTPDEWIDLSTGINRQPYPVPFIKPSAWTALPGIGGVVALIGAARAAYATQGPVLPLAGAQAAIQLIPRLAAPGRARIITPTYNEHAAALRGMGWQVEEVGTPEALAGADLAVIVNPNNPDGRQMESARLLALLPKVGRLVVDESFADPTPSLSLAPQAGQDGLIILRSFGKFFGLAGLRLGFALTSAADAAALAQLAGPWSVSGPALQIGALALADTAWMAATRLRLHAEAKRVDALAAEAGWNPAGGTALFRLYETPNADQAQRRLARARIWSRSFPYSLHWLRLGLPGSAVEWERLAAAMTESALGV